MRRGRHRRTPTGARSGGRAQLGYLDPDGRKSTITPNRRRFALEKAPDAVFEFPKPNDATDLLADTLVVEGLENALSLAELGRSVRIVGLPGIGTLQNLPVRKGEKILIVRDGDKPGSGADKGLIAGVDHLLLEGAIVHITHTPPGDDANSILESDGQAALQELLTNTYPGELLDKGELNRLAKLTPFEYDKERKDAAKRIGINVRTLDKEVGRRRPKGKEQSDASNDPDIDEIELLDEPVVLAQVLDDILVELKRYIVAEEEKLAAVSLWCAHTHLCHHDYINLQRSPRLAIQAVTPGSGKTTLLECVGLLVPRPRTTSSLTASTVLRSMGASRPTLLIDEADGILNDKNSELLSILNAGDRRATAWAERSVPMPDGGWQVQRFFVWGPVAFAGIGELPQQQQDRSIVIQLHKALLREIPEHLEDGMSPELMLLRRKLATWAHDLTELPRPHLPDILMRQAGRTGDNWRVLFAIAQLAGGRWPALVERAALKSVMAEGQETRVQRLLISIKNVFDERLANAEIPDDERERLCTQDLIQALLHEEGEEWDTANKGGRPITEYWLRDNLRHLLNPEGTQQWEGKAQNGKRGKHFRGYLRSQFVSSWERHLPSELLAQNTLQRSGVSGVSGEIQQNQALNHTPDTLVDNGIRCSPPEPVAKSTPDADPYTGSPIPKPQHFRHSTGYTGCSGRITRVCYARGPGSVS